jgi:hypothetical protein
MQLPANYLVHSVSEGGDITAGTAIRGHVQRNPKVCVFERLQHYEAVLFCVQLNTTCCLRQALHPTVTAHDLKVFLCGFVFCAQLLPNPVDAARAVSQQRAAAAAAIAAEQRAQVCIS